MHNSFMTQIPAGDWMLLKDAAVLIGSRQPTLTYHVRNGKIPHIRVGRQVMIERGEAEKFRKMPRPVGRPKGTAKKKRKK